MNLIAYGFVVTMLAAQPARAAEVGWQPLPDGGMEYVIQLHPQAIDSLKGGYALQGRFPLELHDIRGYRITVGEGPVPRTMPDAEARAEEGPPTVPRGLPPDVEGRPLGERQATYAPPVEAPGPARQQTAAASPLPYERPLAAASPPPATPASSPSPSPSNGAPSGTATGASSFALAGALLALFASLGLNVFLGWTTYDARRRYREVLSGDRPVMVREG